ncbi:MAG: TonB family protein [Perlabentimonas sp.]
MTTTSLVDLALKMSIIMMVVWFLWIFIVSKIHRFSLVRFYLLLGILFSCVVPLVLPILQVKDVLTATNIGVNLRLSIPAIEITPNTNALSWSGILKVIYISISAAFFLRFLLQFFRISSLVNSSIKKKVDGLILVEHAKNVPPFSFLNYCFINPNSIPDDKIEGVILHERAHSNYFHSADMILMEIIGVFLWFNPFFWLLRRALVEVHEYQADNEAIQSKGDSYAYLDSIVSLAFNGVALPVGNNFNKSLTLKRLAMINISKKSKGAFFKLALALAIITPFAFIVSCSEDEPIKPGHSDEMLIELRKDSESTNATDTEVDAENEVFVVVEDMPLFKGQRSEAFRKFIGENLTYPEEAAQNGIEGRVFVSFIVEANGEVSSVKTVRGVHPLLDDEAVRVVESSPQWTPGKQRGKAVRTTFTFPISFKL